MTISTSFVILVATVAVVTGKLYFVVNCARLLKAFLDVALAVAEAVQQDHASQSKYEDFCDAQNSGVVEPAYSQTLSQNKQLWSKSVPCEDPEGSGTRTI